MKGRKPNSSAAERETVTGPVDTQKSERNFTATAQRIRLSDLTLSCRIGVTEEERAERQRLRFNIQLETQPNPPQQDRINEVVDYGPLVHRIREVCAEVEFRLLESLATEVARACFIDARVMTARVCIEKLDRYDEVGGIGCEFEYHRFGD